MNIVVSACFPQFWINPIGFVVKPGNDIKYNPPVILMTIKYNFSDYFHPIKEYKERVRTSENEKLLPVQVKNS